MSFILNPELRLAQRTQRTQRENLTQGASLTRLVIFIWSGSLQNFLSLRSLRVFARNPIAGFRIIRIRRDRKAFCLIGAHKKGHPVQHRNSGEDKPATSPEPVFQHRTLYNIVNQGNSPRPKSREDHQPSFLKRPTLRDFT